MTIMREYDTLDDVDTQGAATIADVYALVLSDAMAATDLCGVVTSGRLNLSHSSPGCWGRYPLSFSDHAEVWYVRCAPPGRIGKPLWPDEVRQVSVLVRQSATSKDAVVTNIKLWRLPTTKKLDSVAKDPRQRDRGQSTLGPAGVSVHGINLFDRRATSSTTFTTTSDTHTVMPTIASITQSDAPHAVYRVESCMTPHYVLAAALLDLRFPDFPAHRNCEQSYTNAQWDLACTQNAMGLKSLCETKGVVNDPETYLKVLFTAEDVCEQMSFLGYLDQRADPFYVGALPDDMHKPSGLPLLVTIAVCFACNPGRWGLAPTRSDDAFATKEAALFMEAILPNVMTLGSDCVGGEQVHSFDVVINYAIAQLKTYMSKLQSGQLDGKRGGVNHLRVEQAMKASMSYLLYMGTAVCVNLFGLQPNQAGGINELYTGYGLASYLVDPVMASRSQSAYALGLGDTMDRWPTLRTSTKGRRQQALADVLVEVDQWLKTGRYNGVVLHPTAQASVSVRPEELDPTATPAPPPAPATAAARSAKKKKRPEALLAERGKLRGANQQHCANEAVRSMFKNGCKDDRKSADASEKLCGEALSAATGIFSDILQQGACAGMADLFQITTYLVSPTSRVRCAHCENFVNVVESVAFSGIFGKCSSCRHPRCLKCVSSDINTSSEPCPVECPPQFLNCLFCCMK